MFQKYSFYKLLFFLSLVGVLLYVFSFANEVYGISSQFGQICCADDLIFSAFFIFVPVFFSSLVFCYLKETTKNRWVVFSFVFLVVYFLVYTFSPSESHGFIKFQKEIVAIFSAATYAVISIAYLVFLVIKKRVK